MLLNEVRSSTLDQLELIDNLQRLGLAYHFEDQIQNALLTMSTKSQTIEKDLYTIALEFRIFRQHGFNVSSQGWNVFFKIYLIKYTIIKKTLNNMNIFFYFYLSYIKLVLFYFYF